MVPAIGLNQPTGMSPEGESVWKAGTFAPCLPNPNPNPNPKGMAYQALMASTLPLAKVKDAKRNGSVDPAGKVTLVRPVVV